MAERVEKIYPLAPVDQVLHDYFGLPRTKTVVDALPLPAKVLNALGIPLPGDVLEDVVQKIDSAIKAKVR